VIERYRWTARPEFELVEELPEPVRWTITHVWVLPALLAVSACSGRSASSGGKLTPVERPQGPAGIEEARAYVLSLVNRDRAAEGLDPVESDETAERAGQRHVDDMAKNGFTAHWGTDGSVPEQRYSEAGGAHFVQENAACFFDGVVRELDPNAHFEPAALEKIQAAFMAEVPPNDGHRKNILKPEHKSLGIGLAIPANVDQPCMAQEFLDEYGEYDELPRSGKLGQKITVSGEVKDPVKFGGVGIGRIDPPKPLDPAHLNSTSLYRVPEPYVLFFPAGFKTPKPVSVKGNSFTIDVSLDDGGRPGRYQVSVWGKYPGSDALVMVSLRTVDVR
jgi:uncharacterized protein YkwD